MFESQEFFINNESQITKLKIFPTFRSKATLQVMQNIWEGQQEIIAWNRNVKQNNFTEMISYFFTFPNFFILEYQ